MDAQFDKDGNMVLGGGSSGFAGMPDDLTQDEREGSKNQEDDDDDSEDDEPKSKKKRDVQFHKAS